MKKYIVLSLMALGIVFCLSSLVIAANIPINSVDGDWQNPVDGQNVLINNVANPSTIRWGDSNGYSSYEFLSAVPPAFNALSDGTPFSLGVFTHNNFPITSGTAITQVQLLFSLGIDGLAPFSATFTFNHNETPNNYSPDSDPRNNDIVTLVNPVLNKDFFYDSNGDGTPEEYFFNLIGFVPFGSSTPATIFSTQENNVNNAYLMGEITEIPITTVTPEPTTLLLLGLGLVGLAGFRKRS